MSVERPRIDQEARKRYLEAGVDPSKLIRIPIRCMASGGKCGIHLADSSQESVGRIISILAKRGKVTVNTERPQLFPKQRHIDISCPKHGLQLTIVGDVETVIG